jgi:hypothetical protein
MISPGLSKLGAEADTPLIRWSILAISLIIAWFVLVEPLQGWRVALGEQLDQNAQQAVRLNSLQQRASSWEEAEVLAVNAFEEEIQSLYLQTSDTAAQAVIQGSLQEQCKVLGITIESQRLIDPEDYPVVGRKLAVALNLRGNLADILELLDIIGRASHVLQVDRWFIRKDQGQEVVAQVVVAGFRGEVEQVANEF